MKYYHENDVDLSFIVNKLSFDSIFRTLRSIILTKKNVVLKHVQEKSQYWQHGKAEDHHDIE